MRLVDNGDGTVTDNLTGLVWEKKANLDGVVNASDPHDADNVYSWSKADADPTNEDGTAFTDFLTSLNSGAGFANTNGWRLPTLAELYTLYSLVDGECHKPPCINPVFGTTPIDDFSFYWSSSTLPLNDDILGGSSAWVYLADPTSENFSSGQKTDSFHVRAVRGGFGPL